MGRMRRLLGGRERGPADLITGVVSSRADDWQVIWAGDGAAPATLRAPSLSDAAERAASAVARLYASLPPNPAAELQLAIYPWEYRDGPIFDVSGSPGGFVAQDLDHELPAIYGAALEDLVAAVEPMPEAGPEHCMFRWIRPVSALPAG
jgi:hypothetical protein